MVRRSGRAGGYAQCPPSSRQPVGENHGKGGLAAMTLAKGRLDASGTS